MNRLQEGRDYLFYQIYIWGGIGALVLYFGAIIYFTAYRELIDVPDSTLPGIIMAPVTVWFLGILAYWWWVFLFKGRKELEEQVRLPPTGLPEITALKSWSGLHAAMSLQGGDPEELLDAEKAARLPVIIWYGMSNLLVLWILGNFWVWHTFQETLPTNYIMRIWAPGVIVIMVLSLVATPFLVGRSMKGSETAYLAPLGLVTSELASLESSMLNYLSSAGTGLPPTRSAMNGVRYGRQVQIEIAGKTSVTWVETVTPPFTISSQDGKLVPGGAAPQAVIMGLKGLRKAKRWAGVKATAGSDGIRVERQSPGMNMWLYDLWLIERLLAQFDEPLQPK
jgi:hypothetical protein